MTYEADLSKVSILLKTFLRDNYLYEAVAGIERVMPEAQIIVVDDGEQNPKKLELYRRLEALGHVIILLVFDSGFGKKSNEGAAACKRPYLLIGSDDFDFNHAYVRQGVEKLVAVLDGAPPMVDVASGRVNGYPYEGWLDEKDGRVVERYIKFNQPKHANGVEYHLCNLTVNYSLIRSNILGPGKIQWDDDIKIGGGEHGAQFIKLQRAGHLVAYVPGVNIKEQEPKPTDPRYAMFRMRAGQQPDRPALKRLGVNEYVLFSGGVEKC